MAKNEKQNSILTEVIIINKDFNPFSEPSSLHILHEFCAFIYGFFPSDEDIKTKSPQQILDQMYILINSGVLKEFASLPNCSAFSPKAFALAP